LTLKSGVTKKEGAPMKIKVRVPSTLYFFLMYLELRQPFYLNQQIILVEPDFGTSGRHNSRPRPRTGPGARARSHAKNGLWAGPVSRWKQ
jgi:hypothetical protein